MASEANSIEYFQLFNIVGLITINLDLYEWMNGDPKIRGSACVNTAV